MIPKIDLQALVAKDAGANRDLLAGIQEYGFLIVHNTSLSAADVVQVTDMYRQFFHLPEAEKAHVSMAKTGSNRGWGASGSEQVDPNANPDYKKCLIVVMCLHPCTLLRRTVFMRLINGLNIPQTLSVS